MIEWLPKHQVAFAELKKALTTHPVLRHIESEKEFVIDVDASNFGSGGTLQQYFTDHNEKQQLHPVAYMSKKFNRTQQNYSAQEREMLALVQALEHWRHIVEGAKITIRTDHESLKHFRSQKVMSRRLARFIDVIEHFNPTIVYRPGKNQQAADALSCIPGFSLEASSEENDEIEDNLAVEEEMLNDIDDPYDRTQKFYDALTTYLGDGNIEDEKLEPRVAKEATHYELRDGKLWRYIGNGKRLPVLYKSDDVLKVLENLHRDLGHYGTTITIEAAKKRYYIPNLAAEVKDIVDCCIPCQLYLAKNPPSGPLHEMEAQPAFHT